MNNVEIRTFQDEDAGGVSDVIRSTMRQTNSADYPSEVLEPLIEYFSSEKLIQLSSERYCLVAIIDGRVVGTGAIEDGEIKTLFVYPDFQGKGIGQKVMVLLEKEGRRTGIGEIKVPSSLTGKGFYKKLGYQEGEKFMSEYAGEQIWMTKTL